MFVGTAALRACVKSLGGSLLRHNNLHALFFNFSTCRVQKKVKEL